MSATQIGLNAQDITLRLIGPGDEADEDGNHVPEGQVSLVITDHVNQYQVHITGTAQTLRGLVVEGLSLPIPAGVPLVDGYCPTCTEEGHDTCSTTVGCPCCEDTMSRSFRPERN